jgi:LPS sulfotransferase NodH
MAKPRLIAVVGRQRSGTTVLRQFIGSSSHSFDLGEVFHGLTERKTSFWGFLHSLASGNETFRYPLRWADAWRQFIEHQASDFPFDVFTFDVKVEYFPLILRTNGMSTNFFFDDPAISYVYLHRRNTAAQIISRHVAAATNAWSQTDPDGDAERLWRRHQIWGGAPAPATPLEELALEPGELLQEIAAVRQQDDAIDRLLGHKFTLRLTYENLFDPSGSFAEDVALQVAQISGIPVTEFDRRPILLKQRADGIVSGIANAEVIASSLKAAGYGWMLEEQ